MNPAELHHAFHLHYSGKPAEAEKIYRRILTQNPNHGPTLHLLGTLARETGHFAAALDLLKRAVEVIPANAFAHLELGVTYLDLKRHPEAAQAFRNAIQQDPRYAEAYSNLGNTLWFMGKDEEAYAAYRTAIAVKPDLAEPYGNLAGFLCYKKGRLDEARAAAERAVQLKPDFPDAQNNLGLILIQFGLVEQSIEAFRAAVRVAPTHLGADDNLVYALSFSPSITPAVLKAEHARWERQHAEPLRRYIKPHENSKDPDRPLRIGYVSPDLRDHVVGWNLLPLLSAHDRAQFQIFACNVGPFHDEITGRLKSHTDQWRDIEHLDPRAAADLIRRDRIDILVDLSLHMRHNRILLFALKPAPIQVTYLGYCGTTGLKTVDYRLSDPHLDPPDADESWYTEKTIRLPRTYWCYQPGGNPPDPIPRAAGSPVTFGCLNNFCKSSPAALDLWQKILDRVPGSKLLLNVPNCTVRQTLASRFGDRIEMLPVRSWPEYIATYNQIDIALDPFPYNGGITTCDALFMGVPVVTLAGAMPFGRAGASILNNIGLPQFIAQTPDDYIRIAAELADNSTLRTELRASLRDRMRASPLMDAGQFAKDVESAYRDMWRTWCASKG